MTNQDEPRSEPGHGTPEGYTQEAPGPDELGQRGTPGAGLSPEVPHAADVDAVEHGDAPADRVSAGSAATAAHHDTATDMDAHTTLSDDDHGHAEAVLGPVDWAAWSYALIGLASALVVVALFWLAIN